MVPFSKVLVVLAALLLVAEPTWATKLTRNETVLRTSTLSYDAVLGVRISRDPIGEAGGLNLYGYVENNPVNYSDPLGLFIQYTGWNWDPSNPFDGGSIKSPEQLEEESTRDLTACAAAGAIYGGSLIASAYRIPSTLYHFTSAIAASSIVQQGIRMGPGFFGKGVYGSSVNSAAAARLMGARSTEASVAFSTEGLTVARTLIPGAFRVKSAVPPSSLIKK